MTDNTVRSPLGIFASVISDVFSPLLAPSYGMAIALFLTRLHYLPLSVRLWALIGVFSITCLIPFTAIALLIKAGKVSDTSISDKSQRTIPYCISIACYIGASLFVAYMQAPMWLVMFFAGAAIVSVISLIITYWWKISAHTGGVGGLAAVLFWLAKSGYIESGSLIWASAGFLLVGLMAWSRLYLNRHTLGQVFAGALLSFAVVYTLVSFV